MMQICKYGEKKVIPYDSNIQIYYSKCLKNEVFKNPKCGTLLLGLSRAPELVNNALLKNKKEVVGKVLPGFGISGNVPFSSQGFHHDNFISMSGSWVGAGGNIPRNKFNLLPDAHIRFQNHYSNNGLRYAALRYFC